MSILRHSARVGLASIGLLLGITGCHSSSGGSGVAPQTANPMPMLASVSPTTVIPGGTVFTLTVTGSNFISSSVVNWSGAARATTYISTTQLTAQITAVDITTGGKVPVTVTTPTPGGGTSTAVNVTITAVNASIQQIAPGGTLSQSTNYQLVGTVGPAVDNTNSASTNYKMQGGLTGAGEGVP